MCVPGKPFKPSLMLGGKVRSLTKSGAPEFKNYSRRKFYNILPKSKCCHSAEFAQMSVESGYQQEQPISSYFCKYTDFLINVIVKITHLRSQ